MSADFIIRSIIEGLAVIGIMAGLIFEQSIIKFEREMFGRIKKHFGRAKNKQKRKSADIIVFPLSSAERDNAG